MNIKALMYRLLPAESVRLLTWAGEAALERQARVYAAGGMVRDLLLGIGCLDLDLVVEGDGMALARAISEEYHGRLRVYPRFGTAKILFAGGGQMDVATARVEFYPYPAALPRVAAASLYHDLSRRDFTINAMAVSLNPGSFGEVIDCFGGRADLARGVVRVLHNRSFIDDPVRIMRAVRFEKRYRLTMEPHTRELAGEAICCAMPAKVPAERLWEEIQHVFQEPQPGLVLDRYRALQLWPFLFPGVEPGKVRRSLAAVERAGQTLRDWSLADPGERWLIYLLVVLHEADWTTAAAVCRRYHLNRRRLAQVAAALGGWRRICQNLLEPLAVTWSELARQVKAVPREIYPLILCHLSGDAAPKRFRQVLAAIRRRPAINGEDLQRLGYQPGPQFKKALDALWQARVDGVVRNRREELRFAGEFLKNPEER